MTSHAQDVVRRDGTSLGPIDLTPVPGDGKPVDAWNARYFGGRLSPVALDLLRGLDRADDAFRAEYDARLDRILATTELCPRGDDGYLASLPDYPASIDALEARP